MELSAKDTKLFLSLLLIFPALAGVSTLAYAVDVIVPGEQVIESLYTDIRKWGTLVLVGIALAFWIINKNIYLVLGACGCIALIHYFFR